MDAFVHDVRYMIRILRQRPWVTTVILLTLAIGIGANTAIFSFVDAILVKPLPYPNAGRIVSIWERRPSGQPNAMSALNYVDYARESHVFERVAATTICCSVTMLGGDPSPLPMAGLKVSASYFDVFGVKAAYGRTFLPGEDQPGHNRVVVISHRVWASRFGSDRGLIGRTIRLDDQSYTVVGVMPAMSAFDRSYGLWLPVSFEGDRLNRSSHWLLSLNGGAVGLLNAGVTVQQARAELEGVAGRLATAYPDTNQGWGVVVESYGNTIATADLHRSLYLAVTAAGIVLLIACVNVANMLLAWALARDREIVVRLALGAAPLRLVRQLLTESVFLSTIGGGLGVAVGYGAMSLLRAVLTALPVRIGTLPMLLPADAAVQLDARVLLFAVGVALVCGVLFGLAPALAVIHATRTTMASGHRTSPTRTHRRLHDALIVAQLALAFVLLTSAGLLIRSLANMRGSDVGFDTTNVLTVQVSRSEHHFADLTHVRAFMHAVIEGIRTIPGVVDAAFIDGMPMNGAPRGTFVQRATDPLVPRAQRPLADLKIVGAGYFHVLGLRLRRGRVLTERDRAATPLVAVINETMARAFFPNTDPIGQPLLMDGPARDSTNVAQAASYEVVGVIADERLVPFEDHQAHPVVYASNEQDSRDFSGIIIRTSLDAQQLDRAVRSAVVAVDPDVAVTQVTVMDQWLSEAMIPERFRSLLFGTLAAIALVLATLGIYGVISYSVAQRRHEIGVRAALGATRTRLIKLVVRQGAILTCSGIVVGAGLAVGASRMLRSLLFGVSATDPVTWTAAVVVVASVGLIACYIPARDAAGVDPLEALRAD
jgi:putative ABC transport system permease protein